MVVGCWLVVGGCWLVFSVYSHTPHTPPYGKPLARLHTPHTPHTSHLPISLNNLLQLCNTMSVGKFS
ncbi:hypothetical protein CEN43_18260 [Fischerella thermalis BR2B]|nr:hypothetical protein CEN43_18260 [Fischerella thermalis BR2B]